MIGQIYKTAQNYLYQIYEWQPWLKLIEIYYGSFLVDAKASYCPQFKGPITSPVWFSFFFSLCDLVDKDGR